MKIKLTESQIIQVLSELSNNDIMNHILDKINSGGINTLSPEDRIKLRQLSGEKIKMPVDSEVKNDPINNEDNEENEIRYASLKFIDSFPIDMEFKFEGRIFQPEINNMEYIDDENEYDPTESNFIILSDGKIMVKIYPFYNKTREFRIISNDGFKKTIKFNSEIPSNEDSSNLFVRFFINKTLPKIMQEVLNQYNKEK